MEIKVQTTPLGTHNIAYEKDENGDKYKIRDFYFQIKNIIFNGLSSKEEQYEYILKEAIDKLSKKVGGTTQDVLKQINTILIDFGEGQKDVIEVGEDGELYY